MAGRGGSHLARGRSTARSSVDRRGAWWLSPPPPVLQLLQSNLMVAAGAILALLLMAIRAGSNDKPLRRDLQGAILYLVSFLLIRFASDRVKDLVPDQANKVVRVAWLVALSFGLIRGGVSLVLAFLRVRSSVPTPKIVRDVIDVVLY